MTLTIDLDPIEEARLTAAAHQEGVAPTMLLRRMVNNLPISSEEGDFTERGQARIAAVQTARGSMAHIGVTADDLHQERQSDKQDEERSVMESRQ